MDIQTWYIYISIFIASISLFFEFVILWLIHKIKRWNGYMILIYSMTMCNILYDCFFLFYLQDDSFSYEVEIFLGSYGGLAVTLWTNIISCILFYTISTLTSVDIYKNYKYYTIIAIAFPIVFSLICEKFYIDHNNSAMKAISWLYYWLRILSIVINIVIYVWIDIIIKALDKDLLRHRSNNHNESISSLPSNATKIPRGLSIEHAITAVDINAPLNPNTGRASENSLTSFKSLTNLINGSNYFTRQLSRDDVIIIKMKVEAIRTLAFRMKYYPICQVIVRSVTAIRNYQVNKGTQDDDNNLNDNVFNKIILMLTAFVTPSAGFLFFIVFLIVQPKAKTILMEIFFNKKQKKRTISMNTYNSYNTENSEPDSIDEEVREEEKQRQSFRNIINNRANNNDNNNNNGFVIEESDDGWLEYIQTMDEGDLMDTISALPGSSNVGNSMFAEKDSEGNFTRSSLNRTFQNSLIVDSLNQSRLSQTSYREYGRENNSFNTRIYKSDL